MKQYKKSITLAVAFFVMLIMAVGVSAEETLNAPIIAVGADVSSVAWHEYQMTNGMLTVPVQASSDGELIISYDADIVVDGAIGKKPNMSEAIKDWKNTTIIQKSQKEESSESVKKGDVIYIHFKAYDTAILQGNINLKVYEYPYATGGSLSQGKEVAEYGSGNSVYYKVNVKKSGILTVISFTDEEGIYPELELCTAKKKEIASTVNEGKVCYGVKKGTYYLKVTKSGVYHLSYTFQAKKITGNTKKAKAITMKKGKSYTGIFVAGEKSNERYFKFTTEGTKKINFSLDMQMAKDSTVEVGVFRKKGNKLEFVGFLSKGKNYSISGAKKVTLNTLVLTKKSKKLTKGTYYIMLENRGSTQGGSYSIKMK